VAARCGASPRVGDDDPRRNFGEVGAWNAAEPYFAEPGIAPRRQPPGRRDTPGVDVADEMTERRNRLFPLVRTPHVDKAVPGEAGHGRLIGAVATIR
jgi:hypothetical protein